MQVGTLGGARICRKGSCDDSVTLVRNGVYMGLKVEDEGSVMCEDPWLFVLL